MAQFGIIGKSLGHSFSPVFFNAFFRERNLPHTYNTYEIPTINDVFNIIDKNPELQGINVTIPYKQEIVPLLDSVSKEAAAVGAVNTIVIERKAGKIFLHGHNTDIYGFKKTIENCDSTFRNALILGSGGASKAVVFVLQNSNIVFKQVSRNPLPGQYSYADLENISPDEYDLIVNTTPVGMYPHVNEMPAIPAHCFNKDVSVIDLIYNPEKTLLLKNAELKGCKIVNGSLMLEQQALQAWKIWSEVQ